MPQWLVPVSRIFYAIGLIGIGIQHFVFADFIPVILPYWPAWIPGRPLWAYLMGALLIAAGSAIIFGIRARTVAAVTGLAILAIAIVDDIPAQLAGNPRVLAAWGNVFKAFTMCGGAWAVAASLEGPKMPEWLETLMPVGRFFLPITVAVFGFEHFIYTKFVATLVPSWIPGSYFWTYFGGAALMAAGLGMIFRVQARLASLLLGIMIFLWFVFLHIPRAIADPHTLKGNEWTSVFEALAFSGIAFIVAALPASNPLSIVSATSGAAD